MTRKSIGVYILVDDDRKIDTVVSGLPILTETNHVFMMDKLNYC